MPNENRDPLLQIDSEIRDKAGRLFAYLAEVCQLRFVLVRDCRNYDQMLWFHEIPREPECSCIAWNEPTETNESWIEVRRSPEPPCPAVPADCKDWVPAAEVLDSSQTPVLQQRIRAPSREDAPPDYLELSGRPDVTSKWQEYLRSKWEPWAREHRRWGTVQQVYGKLFKIYQQQKRLGESFELRLGFGLLSWLTPSGERVYRHLVVGQANITFDANRGVISVQAAGEGTKLTLEHDMLEPGQLPTQDQHEVVDDGIQANAETPWERNLIEPLLRRWVQAMNQQGRGSSTLSVDQ